MTAARLDRVAVTIADLSRQVGAEQLTSDAALCRAYAIGYADGLAQREDDRSARVVRVSERMHEPEIQS